MMTPLPLLLLASLVPLAVFAQQGPVPQGARGQARPGAPAPAGAQARPRDGRPAVPAAGTASISGRVSSPEGRPLRRAQVRLTALGAQFSRMTVTNAEGVYEFKDLPAGRFMLNASKSGHVAVRSRTENAGGSGQRVDLNDGGRLEKTDFVLSRGCAITGRVFDELGDPATDIFVTALAERSIGGRRQLGPGGGNTRPTDDLGQYRIWGLAAGEYLVSATAQNDIVTREQPPSDAERSGYAPTYYPGTPRASEAARLRCEAGQEFVADFTLVAVRTSVVSGRVVDSQGRPMANGFAMMTPPGHVTGPAPMTSLRPDGSFLIGGVPPGEYTLTVQSRGAPASADREVALLPLVVGGSDITGLLVQATRGARISGRLVPDSGLTFDASLGRASVMAAPADPSGSRGYGSAAARVQEDGRFELRGVFGTVTLRASVGNWRLQEVRVEGQDRTDQLLEFKGNEDVTAEIVLTNRLCTLAGQVTDERGAILKDAAVIVFSEDAARWRYPSRYIGFARTLQDGDTFRLQTLPPGRYLAVGVDFRGDDYQDPEFLERLRPLATRVTLNEGETTTVALKLREAPGPGQ